jgi:alcohol dehydrogenase class IV
MPDGIRLVASAMGLDTTGTPASVGKKVKIAIQEFSDSLGQKKLSQMNIPETDFEKIAQESADSPLAGMSPKKATKEDVMKWLKEAYSR